MDMITIGVLEAPTTTENADGLLAPVHDVSTTFLRNALV